MNLYVGKQTVVERKRWLVEVMANDIDEAREKMARGEGRRRAFYDSEVIEEGAVEGVEEQFEEMGS